MRFGDSSGEVICWYCFAALYIVVAVLTFSVFITSFSSNTFVCLAVNDNTDYSNSEFKLHYYFRILALTFTVMCTIRSIYFFLLPSRFEMHTFTILSIESEQVYFYCRVLEDSSTSGIAYFLIEFPTMLYFTSFSSLGAFW